jgi:hypothetical protein
MHNLAWEKFQSWKGPNKFHPEDGREILTQVLNSKSLKFRKRKE